MPKQYIRLSTRLNPVICKTVRSQGLAPDYLQRRGRAKRTEAFNDAVAVSKARHQEALPEASRAFNAKHAETKRKHREAYIAAIAAWDALKSDPDAEGYEELVLRLSGRFNTG